MKRDPRLRPLSARRSERRLHGLRLTDAYQIAQRIAAAFDLSFRPSYFKRMTEVAKAHEQAHARLVAHLRKTADAVAGDLTRQLRRDFALYGEAHVHVGWDDALQAPTPRRVPPEAVTVRYQDASGTERSSTPTDTQLAFISEGTTGGVEDWQPPCS